MGDKPIRKPLLLLVLCIFIELCTSSQNMWNAGVDSRDDLFLSCWRPSLRLGLKWTLVLNQTKTHFYCSEFRLDLQWRTGSDFWCGSNLGTHPFKKWFQEEVFILKTAVKTQIEDGAIKSAGLLSVEEDDDWTNRTQFMALWVWILHDCYLAMSRSGHLIGNRARSHSFRLDWKLHPNWDWIFICNNI